MFDPFILLDPDAWFNSTFGAEWGGALASEYKRNLTRIPASLGAFFLQSANQEMTDIDVVKYDRNCSNEANEFQYPRLSMRVRNVPFYEVRARRSNMYRSLWFFVYSDSAFRYIGVLNAAGAPDLVPGDAGVSQSGDKTKIERVGQTAQLAKLLQQEVPVYPTRARQTGFQGKVQLAALIGTDGAVREIRVVQGQCWFAEAAVDAVRKWKYAPTVVDGKPVEVSTTIEVVFSLHMGP